MFPISISISEELPVKIIEAVTLSQPEVEEPLSQLKSILLLLPVVEKVPVKLSPSISKVSMLLLPTWSMLKFFC